MRLRAHIVRAGLLAALLGTVTLGLDTTAAAAHTVTAVPTVTAISPASCTAQECDVPVRTPVTFTFRPGRGSRPVAYLYQLNSGPPVRVHATHGSWTGQIVPREVGPNTLSVQAVAADGTPSDETPNFFINATPVPASDGDFTGDGHPDLLTVGGNDGLPAGLWLSPGDGTGHVGDAVDIGVNGNGLSTEGSPDDWDGAVATSGQFMGTGEQDILVAFPVRFAGRPQTVAIYRGTGDGSPLPTQITGSEQELGGAGCLFDADFNCVTVTQITAMGSLPNSPCAPDCEFAAPDLFGVVNGQLWWFPAEPGIGDYDPGVVLDSTTDWSAKQISGTVHNGSAALVVRDVATGEVDLYTGGAPGTNWFTGATTTVVADGVAADRITAVDADSDGTPDLWTTQTDGSVAFYPGIDGTPVSAGHLTPQ